MDVRVLGRHVDRHLAGGRVVGGEHRARLDRVGDQTVVAEVEFHRVRGGGESRVDRFPLADFPVERHVAGRFVVDCGRAVLKCRDDVGHGVERFVVDGDPVRGVAGDVAVFGDHHGHCVADVTDRVGRDHRVGGGLEIRQQPADRDDAGNAGGGDVGAR